MTSHLVKLLLVLTLALSASLTTAPANALGKVCKTYAGAKRCAEIGPRGWSDPTIVGKAATYGQDQAVVRIVKVELQRRTSSGWTTVNSWSSDNSEYYGTHFLSLSKACDEVRRGTFRTRARSKWITGGSYFSGWVASRGVKKSRLC